MRTSHGSQRRGRRGLTLYEVVLALAVLLISTSILVEFLGTGRRAATQSRLRTEALLLCQSKLAEVVAGIEPLQSVAGAAVGTTTEWQWSLEVVPGPHPDLLELRAAVAHVAADGSVDADASLVRYLRDPALFEQTTTESTETESATSSGTEE